MGVYTSENPRANQVLLFFSVISLMYSLLIDIVIQFLDPHEYQEATIVT